MNLKGGVSRSSSSILWLQGQHGGKVVPLLLLNTPTYSYRDSGSFRRNSYLAATGTKLSEVAADPAKQNGERIIPE